MSMTRSDDTRNKRSMTAAEVTEDAAKKATAKRRRTVANIEKEKRLTAKTEPKQLRNPIRMPDDGAAGLRRFLNILIGVTI